MESNHSKSNKSSVILGLLLLLAILGGGYLWSQNKAINSTNDLLSGQVSVLKTLRTDLLEEVEILQSDFDAMIHNNALLEIDYEDISEEVNAKKVEIQKIKKAFATNAAGMQTEINQLKGIKKELTALLNQLTEENTQLKEANEDLAIQVANVETRNKELEFQTSQLRQTNRELEKEKSGLMATATRATDLRVDIRKKGDKPTSSSRRAKEIAVSFAISNLPDNRKGDQKIYVVVKNRQGLPIKVANPIKATIKSSSGGKAEEIIAQQMQIRNLFEKDRLQMTILPETGSLKAGYYRVSIYADWGLLGGAEFQLK